MSTRKYAYGYEKLKNIKKEEKLIESQKGSMDKFFISNKQNIIQNLDEKYHKWVRNSLKIDFKWNIL